jgi:hypothetical protein
MPNTRAQTANITGNRARAHLIDASEYGDQSLMAKTLPRLVVLEPAGGDF